MKRNLALFAACASAAAMMVAGAAHATVTKVTTGTYVANPNESYDLNPYFVKTGTTSSAKDTKNVPGGVTQTYDFSFGIKNDLKTTAFGSFGFDEDDQQAFTDANLQLYSGTVGGTYAFVTGIDYDPQTDPQQSFSADLSPGNYFVQATVTTAKGGGSSPITLSATVHHISAAPEPSTWLLMMMGVGALGLGLRYQRRQLGALAA